jgi:hypothetical protein
MPRRLLSPTERAEVELVFGAGLDYTRVFVVEDTPFPNRVADLGRSPKPNAVTLGNVSYFPHRLHVTEDALRRGDLREIAWLIHEVTHQWQFQRLGWRYLTSALWTQLTLGQKGYHYELQAGRPLAGYNMEQQADIARDYYTALKRGQDISAWAPLVAEFRKA